MSVGFVQDQADFVANQVFPAIPVNFKSDLYYIYNRGDFFRNQMVKRAPGTPAAAGGYKLTTSNYTCDVWALKKIIDDQIRANSDIPLQPDRDATFWLTQQALVNRDVAWVSAYFTTGVWGTDITGNATSSSTQAVFWSSSGSTPIEDVLTARLKIKQNTGYWANTLVIGAAVHKALKTNPEIIDRLKYGQTAPGPVKVSTSDLAQLFEVERVVVASAIQTTSSEDSLMDSDDSTSPGPDTFDFIAGKNAGLFYAAPAPGIFTPSAGYTFNWTGLTGATAAGMRVKKFRWEVDAADHVEIEQSYAFGKVAKAMGYFWSSIVQ
jgi:hypothetical protein